MRGIEIISSPFFADCRGSSRSLIDVSKFGDFCVNEVFHSFSKENTIRGLHYQGYPFEQKKYISIIRGHIKGVVLDLRKESETYLMAETYELDAEDINTIIIPRMCAWGFEALTEAELVYLIDGIYDRNHDFGVRWDSVGADWSEGNHIISDRDIELPTLKELIDGKLV